METVDPEITATCKDLGAVRKLFQLALLCAKRQPTDRPTMHEVTRVLDSLMPPAAPPKQASAAMAATPQTMSTLPAGKLPCYVDEYANLKTPHLVNCPSMSTSDAQLFLKFGEVISQNSTQWKKKIKKGKNCYVRLKTLRFVKKKKIKKATHQLLRPWGTNRLLDKLYRG